MDPGLANYERAAYPKGGLSDSRCHGFSLSRVLRHCADQATPLIRRADRLGIAGPAVHRCRLSYARG